MIPPWPVWALASIVSTRFADFVRVERRTGIGMRGGSAVNLYGVVSLASGEVLEVFATRAEADGLVATWDRDEPSEAGSLEVVELAIDRPLN